MNRSVLKHKVTRVKAVAWCRVIIIQGQDLARGKMLEAKRGSPDDCESPSPGFVGPRSIRRTQLCPRVENRAGHRSPAPTMEGRAEKEPDGRPIIIRRSVVIRRPVIVSGINIHRAGP